MSYFSIKGKNFQLQGNTKHIQKNLRSSQSANESTLGKESYLGECLPGMFV